MRISDDNIEAIRELCFKHNVARLFVFGSVLTEKFKKNSDIDMIVDFSGVDVYNYADNYFDLKFSLEKLLKREVDLLEEKAVKNPLIHQNKSFMDNEIQTCLYDILLSINEIDSYCED